MAEIDFFYQNFWKYWNGALYLVPYLGCLVYLVYKKDKKLMELFVWPFLILLATVYNPFLMRPIIEKMGWEDRYMRCLLYTSPSPRDGLLSRMPSSA